MIPTFEEFLNEQTVNESEKLNEEGKNTMKSAVMDYMQKKKKASRKEILSVMLKYKGFDENDPKYKNYYGSYFSGHSKTLTSTHPPDTDSGRNSNSHGMLMIPTLKDPRYIEQVSRGNYVFKVWDKKSKLNNVEESLELNEAKNYDIVHEEFTLSLKNRKKSNVGIIFDGIMKVKNKNDIELYLDGDIDDWNISILEEAIEQNIISHDEYSNGFDENEEIKINGNIITGKFTFFEA